MVLNSTIDPPVLPPPADFLVSARGLMEYRGMFRLANDELRDGRILDCPGGAASFAAEVRALGGTVVSVDPQYARSHEALCARARADVERASAHTAEYPQVFSWTFFRSIEHHRQVRADACQAFVWDHADPDARPWYVPGALPNLPFPDGSFSLTLSSHLLFTYEDRIDKPAHVDALRELLRVTVPGGEVRVFPLIDASGRPSAILDDVLAELRTRGVRSRVEKVWYEAVRGGNQLLRLRQG